MDLDIDINKDFEENSLYQEGCDIRNISKIQ